jgi:polyhydroxyalkanoate synthesis regulator phasin
MKKSIRRNKMDDIRLEMLKSWQSSWKSYVKTLTTMQEQGEKMLDLLFTQSETVRDETKKLIKEGMDNAKEAQKSYLDSVEENIKKIEDLLAKK